MDGTKSELTLIMVRAGGFADSAGILLGMNRVLCNFEGGLCNCVQIVGREQNRVEQLTQSVQIYHGRILFYMAFSQFFSPRPGCLVLRRKR